MKVLWLVNILMPDLARHLGRTPSVFGGWLNGASETVKQSEYELVICATSSDNIICGCYDIDDVRYYISELSDITSMQAAFDRILNTEKPDLVHIFGTEFEQSWALASMVDADKLLVTIQGSLLVIKDLAYAGISAYIADDNVYHRLLRRIHKGGQSIELQKKSFEARAEYELKTLKKAEYIHGGSDWGNSVAKAYHPGCTTFECGLTLRNSFYCDDSWNYQNCDNHSIYSVFTYPVKGFHKLLEAVSIVKNFYPDVKIYAVANTLIKRNYSGYKRWLMKRAPDYNWYVQSLMDKYDLWDNVEFVGYLTEEQVKAQLMKSNVFVSPSSIENQSTALGEAMILGVPSIASCVGAMQEMIDDGKDGFLYPFNEPHLLATKICQIFENRDLAEQFSRLGREHAMRTYNREENSRKLLEMYQKIINNQGE